MARASILKRGEAWSMEEFRQDYRMAEDGEMGVLQEGREGEGVLDRMGRMGGMFRMGEATHRSR